MRKLFTAAMAMMLALGVAHAQAPSPAQPGKPAATMPAPSAAPAAPVAPAMPAATPAAPAAAAAAAPAAGSCEAKAVDKNGKPLHGAAKTSFMKKCDAGN